MIAILADLDNLGICNDRSAELCDLVCCYIPELTGTKLRIFELLDKRSVDLTIFYLKESSEVVSYDAKD